MSEVEVRGLTVGYAGEPVLRAVDLSVPSGSITAVLGDSGSGKSTLLKAIAGFLRPSAGEVRIGERTVVGPGEFVAPERRGIGYVRQDGGLFPHLSVAGNIAFGLPFPRRRHRPRVLELLDLVGLEGRYADRYPDALSGGQQQRVALARALALDPSVVLLDEPFSALDTALREATREATAAALRQAAATAVLVTHDQAEALSFTDQVAVLQDGSFRQVAAPREVYAAPADLHVAGFLGDVVLLPGEARNGHVRCALGQLPVTEGVATGSCRVMVRPEQIRLVAPAAGAVDATVGRCVYYGHDALLELALNGSPETGGVRARVVGTDVPTSGERVGLVVTGPVRVFGAD